MLWHWWSARVATLPLCLKHTQPWHLTAVMSFLGLGTRAVKGLLNWGSETLPSETMYSGSRQWKLLPMPCGSVPRHPVVIHKHAPLLPCPSLARTISQTNRTLSLGLPEWAELRLCRGTKPSRGNEEKTNKSKSKTKKEKKNPVFSWNWSIFHGPWLEQNLSLHPISKALSFQCALKIKQAFLPLLKWQKQWVGQMIIRKVKPSGDTHLMIRNEVKKAAAFIRRLLLSSINLATELLRKQIPCSWHLTAAWLTHLHLFFNPKQAFL